MSPARPASAEIAAKTLTLDTARLGRVLVVPGVSAIDARGAPDVMRGEETQILGALAAGGRDDGLFVLPGTHSKWARVEAGRIVAFTTFMTGEIFAALKDHTVLGRMMAPGANAAHGAEGFARGLTAAQALERPGDLLTAVFKTRTLALFDALPADALADYLSGVLIGAEILAGGRGVREATIVGSAALTARYQTRRRSARRRTHPRPGELRDARADRAAEADRGALAAPPGSGVACPWIGYRRPGPLEFPRVAGDDGEAVAKRARRDDEVGLREGVARCATSLDQSAPLEHDILADRQDARLEHRPQRAVEPILERGALKRVGDALDAETDLGEGYDADEQGFERLGGDKRDDLGLGPQPTQLAQHIRVEQPARHSSTSRTGAEARRGAISISRSGEACSASISAAPVRSPFKRRNSSAATTTTSSRPRTVTSCGPSLRARRTSSLKRALASCRSQAPGRRGGRDGLFELVMLTRLVDASATRKTRSARACAPTLRRAANLYAWLRQSPPLVRSLSA